MVGKLLLFVALGFICVDVGQSRRPLRDFAARPFKPFMGEERNLMRSEDEEDRERREYWRDPRKSGMYDDYEGTMNERRDEDTSGGGEDKDVEELLSDSDGEDPSTTESPSTDESGTKFSSSSTEPAPSTEATTTVGSTAESTTTTASSAASTESTTSVKPTDGLAEKVKEALKELTSSVSKQEKFCAFLTEKLQGRIFDTLEAEVKEIETAVLRGLNEVRANRKRSTGSLLEGILGQLRDMRLKLRRHRF